MASQRDKAAQFKAMHVRGAPLVLFNIWDVGSARAIIAGGAQAIATCSWSVANANGYADGEHTPLDLAVENLCRLTRATDLPVTADLERGYGDTAEAVGKAVSLAIDAGAVGCNLEDGLPAGGLREPADQADRIACARRTADALSKGFFINARTDVFFQCPTEEHNDAMVAVALRRGRQYAEAGADGLFVPGVTNIRLIASLAAASALPLNIMVADGTPSLRVLAEHGVARVSHGAGPYLAAMRTLESAARAAAVVRDA